MKVNFSSPNYTFQSGSLQTVVIDENNVFSQIKRNLNQMKQKYYEICFECDLTSSMVERKKKKIVKVHPFISLTLSDGSIICFGPNEQDGLEISQLVCSKKGRGQGTYLMNTFFDILNETLGFIPPLYLECTGSIFFKEFSVLSSIHKQTKFFRKFGFRVANRKEYPYYVDMRRYVELAVAC
jgi:hypothetical protein